MKKFFTFVAVAFAAISMNAADVVSFAASDFSGKGTSGTGSEVTVTKDGVTFTCDKAFGNDFAVRCYVGAHVSITSATENIGKLEFEFDSQNNKVYDGGLETAYTPNAKSWSLPLDGDTLQAQARFKAITVYLGEATEITYDTLTVAEAITAADALADNAESAQKVYVEGFAVNVSEYSAQYGNQDFYLADDASATESTFMVYRATPEKDGAAYPVIKGDQLRLFGKLKKYVKDGATTLEIVSPTVEFIAEAAGDRIVPEVTIDTITVTRALEIIDALAEGGKTAETYVVKGFAGTAYEYTDGKQTWYMADEPDVYCTFQAASCTPDREVAKGDFMLVTGVLTKYKTSAGKIIPEIYSGTAVHGEAPKIDTIAVTVAEALDVVAAMTEDGTTSEIYAITGYIASIKTPYDADYNNMTFFLSDDASATSGDIQVYRGKMEDNEAAFCGQQVRVVGRITKSGTYTPEVANGKVKKLTGLGVENVELTEKAQKVMVDGVLYIVRDGKMFDVRGTQVR